MNENAQPVDTSVLEPADIELDLARSAWFDKGFAVWFAPFAKRAVLFNGVRGEDYFQLCGEFAKAHRAAPSEAAEDAAIILTSQVALEWFRSFDFPELPGGRSHKPTTWQIEKARKYLSSRHNRLLSEKLADAEAVREAGDPVRADRLATEARRAFASFSDASVSSRRAMDDVDAIVALAESTPPIFTLDGEIGRLLNSRLKPDNFGIVLGDQKSCKTTTLLCLAIEAAKKAPTLFISTGDETESKLNARITTNLSGRATQPEYAGRFAVPVPDCAHNAAGTCPISMGSTPRLVRDWKRLVAEGATRYDMAEGVAEGSRNIDGGLYQPCCRCFPKNDGTQEDRERRKRWKSAVWWRLIDTPLVTREVVVETRNRFEIGSVGGGLRIAAYSTGKLSVEGVYELLEMLDRTENFVPEVIVIDYADLMKQKPGRDSDKDHDGMRGIWEDLRSIPFTLHNLLITATQTNGLSDGVETYTKRMIGRSKKAADNCTWLLTINSTVDEKRAKVMRASLLYAREGDCDPEHQALCCQWLEVQDAFAFSMPIFCKIKNEGRERE